VKKQQGWEQALHDFFVRAKNIPFDWGKWDCCIFADEALQAIYGEKVIPNELKWDDERTAKRAILRYGDGCLGLAVGRAAKKAGMEEVLPCIPEKGDLVLHDSDNGLAVGIYDGYAIAAPSDDGLATKSRRLITKAYRAYG
jgi:hypothetical protein